MADIFISYASRDRERAQQLADTLTANFPWTVWWDRDIAVGRNFDEEISRELERASCVIVLWTANAKNTDWVGNEVAAAAKRKVLIPALYDGELPPLQVFRLQGCNLNDWDGDSDHEEFRKLIKGVSALIADDHIVNGERRVGLDDQPQAQDLGNPPYFPNTANKKRKGGIGNNKVAVATISSLFLGIIIGIFSTELDFIDNFLIKIRIRDDFNALRNELTVGKFNISYSKIIEKFESPFITIFVAADPKNKDGDLIVENASPKAEQLFGQGIGTIKKKKVSYLVTKRLRKYMDPDDYNLFIEDQTMVLENYKRGEVPIAKVPIVFNSHHTDRNFRNKVFYPVIAHRYEDDSGTDHLAVIYLDMKTITEIAELYVK